MDDKLVPAHILFARWFIRIRWFAIAILLVSNYIVSHVFEITIEERSIYYLNITLLILNIIHSLLLKRISRKERGKVIPAIKKEIHFQIVTDLALLTMIIHYSGGIENPLILFYFLHMIIASSIYSTPTSYFYATFAILMAASLILLECYSVIPHYPLKGFVDHELYRNTLYVFGSGFIFASTSIIVVSLTHMIIYRSIKSEEGFVETNIELENKDKLKNEYVLRVTHDIKGHVAAILSCLEVIRNRMAGPLNEEQENFANRAYERTELLAGFVKNLLNLTRKRLSHDSEFEEFVFSDMINKVISHVEILAKDKSINLNIYIDKSIKTITGNPFTIEELYSNLLQNAIKYTPQGGRVELSVKNRFNHIVSEVSDSGIGIANEDLPNVFDEFYRGTNVPKDIKTGSGLGLSIVKQIVENHKGKIWVTSELGVWTKFSFILPKNPSVLV